MESNTYMAVTKQDEVVKNILRENSIDYTTISKAESGFTNDVYFIDDKYVVKLSNNKATKEKLEKETVIYRNLDLSFIPEYITSGAYADYRYLIITKVSGKSLYSVWHTLPRGERVKIINELAEMLKTFHQVDGTFLKKYSRISAKEYVRTELLKITKALQGLGFNTSCLENVVNERLDELFSDVATGLVYNDLHFDNIIYDGEKLYLIDFDRTLVSALDYDMMIFKTMCENPSKFANKKDEVHIDKSDYADIYPAFRAAYPELFLNNFVDDRITIYQFIYLINQALGNSDSECVKRELRNFEAHLSR